MTGEDYGTSREACQIVCRALGGGSSNGAFVDNLMDAFLVADPGNFEKLGKVYPEIAGAINCYRTEGFTALVDLGATL